MPCVVMLSWKERCESNMTYKPSNLGHIDLVFKALLGMQRRSSDENTVCLSVCLSNAWIVTKRKKDLSRFYTIRKII